MDRSDVWRYKQVSDIHMYVCDSWICPMVKALIIYRIIKVLLLHILGVCWIQNYKSKVFSSFMLKELSKFNPHSAFEIHRSAPSYCRSMLFHKVFRRYKGFSSAVKRFRICFALVQYHMNLRFTRLGLAEPEVEEGVMPYSWPCVWNNVLRMEVSCP